MRAAAPVLPVVAVVAALALPITSDAEGGATPADAVSGLLVLWCAAGLLRDRRRPLTRTAAVVLGLPVVGLALAAAGAGDPGAGIAGLGRYLQVFVLVPVAVLLCVRSRSDFRVVAWSFVGLALWQGAVGVHQYATGTGASYAGEDIRAVGTFGAGDVMGMATVVSFGLVCAVGLALAPATAKQRAWALVCSALLVLPLAVSFSRGAWIAAAAACGLQVVLAGLRRAVAVFAAVAAVGVVLVGGLGIGSTMLQDRISSITRVTDAPDQSVTDRYTMWAAAAGMWREQPLTGVGLKGFPEHRDSNASLALSSGSDIAGAGTAYQKQPLLSPHNMYLLVLSEQGLIGLLALGGSWLALAVCGARGLVRARREAGHGGDGGHGARAGHERGADGSAGGAGGIAPGTGGIDRRSGGVDRRAGGVDCGLVACGLVAWVLVDFMYADIGGPTTVLTAVCFGLVAWWALADRTATGAAPVGAATARVPEEAGTR
ncbi:O-antigen ligase family protein [Streptomyces sp. SP18BB07]|uniref:O-antigen ligase family protein n=1 Tax=Streptomyces sp. SP18BB07 TaxID=3002522 RepID=UPI002E7829BB|nr:O-antigen ligase family protein [Streptomyces sp. SP18BB07]MEE1765999.1 O-antigen ligase family protein [Streptomyces sp. SP18BB07]